MADANKIIDSLSGEELDLLNSDPKMLAEFKAKHVDGAKAATDNLEFERSSAYPTQDMTDPSIDVAMMASGAGGLGKAALSGGKALLAETVVPTLKQATGNQSLRSLGASVGQVRQMGVDEAREAGKYALDNGLVDVMSTDVGRQNKLKALLEMTGKKIGDLRGQAGAAPEDMAKKISTELAPKYTAGVYSGEKGALKKAIDEVAKTPATHADLSKTATNLNRYASENGLVQPTNAATDVANSLSRSNNEGIVQSLGADKGKQYLGALEDMSKQKPIEQFMARGEAKEAAGRGSNTMFGSVTGAIKDVAGHRLGAKLNNAGAEAGEWLAGKLPSAADGAGAMKAVAGSGAMSLLRSNPAALGRYAAPLQKAFDEGGEQAVAAMNYVLSSVHPDYNELTQDR